MQTHVFETHIFETAAGFCGIAWGPGGIARFALPVSSAARSPVAISATRSQRPLVDQTRPTSGNRRSAVTTARTSAERTSIAINARTAGPSASTPSRTVKPSTTPPARSRAMRFCTVPRDTPSRRASVALGIRLSARSSPISRWSRSSSGVIWRMANLPWRSAQASHAIRQIASFSLAPLRPTRKGQNPCRIPWETTCSTPRWRRCRLPPAPGRGWARRSRPARR